MNRACVGAISFAGSAACPVAARKGLCVSEQVAVCRGRQLHSQSNGLLIGQRPEFKRLSFISARSSSGVRFENEVACDDHSDREPRSDGQCRPEPRRVCRTPFGVCHAVIAMF